MLARAVHKAAFSLADTGFAASAVVLWSGGLQRGLAADQVRAVIGEAAQALDAASRRQLDRGARLTELLRQGQYQPYPVEDQVVSVWAGTNGHFDDIPVEDVLRFESELLEHLRRTAGPATHRI